MILTAAFVGLRFGELAGLKVDRVNLLRRTIPVDQQLIEIGRELCFGPPKTKAGIRKVTIPAALCDVLAQHFGLVRDLAFPNINGGSPSARELPSSVAVSVLARRLRARAFERASLP